MKLINRDTDYAVRAICYIAKNKGRTISVRELVSKLRIPRPFLRKTLQVLNKKKLLKSYKGQGGGFRLGRQADKIFLLDLIKIFQGKFKLNECFFKKTICPFTADCMLKKKIDTLDKYVVKELASINIRHLLR